MVAALVAAIYVFSATRDGKDVQFPAHGGDDDYAMASIDTINLTILLGALLVFAGILSSLVALRFGAPLLFIFLLIGMLAAKPAPAASSSTTSGAPIRLAPWRSR